MLVLSESYVNANRETRYGDSGWQEPWTDDIGRLYRALVREFGRCSGHVYVDTTDGETIPVGWVFVKRVEYDDAGRYGFRGDRTYLREVWVSVGEQDEEGDVWRYDVKRRKGTMPN
jgi:hypothetical protein